jgi:inosine-uridine nucleoside N-ribohydrolase
MHKAGSIELIGIVITSDDPYAPSCASAMSSFYHLPDIPIGYLKDQPKLNNHSRYTRLIADEFPHQLNAWQDAEEAASLYRRLLAQNADESVVIVTIGHLTSLQQLLQSNADAVSPLSGQELAKQKVSRWLCMGGHFPEGKEANFYRPDPLSTVYCVNNWQKEVIFCGWEIGNKIITGGSNLKQALNPTHPLYRGYELYNNFAGRPSWDQVAVLLLTDQGTQFFNYQRGKCLVETDGSNGWQKKVRGRHKYAIFKASADVSALSGIVESLMTRKP